MNRIQFYNELMIVAHSHISGQQDIEKYIDIDKVKCPTIPINRPR